MPLCPRRPRRGRRRATSLGVVISALAGRQAAAYRPFDQTDADVAAVHEVELELGPIGIMRDDDGTTFIPGFIFNYGFAPTFELVMDAHAAFLWGGRDAAARRRQHQTSLSLKHVLRAGSLQGETGPSLAAEVGALLPTIPAAGHAGGALALIVSQRWPDLTVHVNAEGDLTRAGGRAFIVGAIVEGPERWPLRPVAELLSAHETDSTATYSALAGMIWRATEAISPDLAVRGATEAGAPVYELRVGLTWSH